MVGNDAIVTVMLPSSNTAISLTIGATIQQETTIKIVNTKWKYCHFVTNFISLLFRDSK